MTGNHQIHLHVDCRREQTVCRPKCLIRKREKSQKKRHGLTDVQKRFHRGRARPDPETAAMAGADWSIREEREITGRRPGAPPSHLPRRHSRISLAVVSPSALNSSFASPLTLAFALLSLLSPHLAALSLINLSLSSLTPVPARSLTLVPASWKHGKSQETHIETSPAEEAVSAVSRHPRPETHLRGTALSDSKRVGCRETVLLVIDSHSLTVD